MARGLAAALVCVWAVTAEAALPLQIPFQSGLTFNCNGVGSHALTVSGSAYRGTPASSGVGWYSSVVSSGGFNNRGYFDFYWWDWDVSQVPYSEPPGPTSLPAGYIGTAGNCLSPYTDTTYYLRMRLKINAPIYAHSALNPPVGMPDGDTQMKWFIWGRDGDDGTMRAIVMLYAGNANGNSGACGGTAATQFCIELCAGVTSNCARTLASNGEWVSLQFSWRWGPTGTAFQRIYVNNNTEGSPTASNTSFTQTQCTGHPMGSGEWCFPGTTSLEGQFNVGDIDNTGSAVSDDANVQTSDIALATSFDSNWYQSDSVLTCCARLRGVSEAGTNGALLGLGLLPFLMRRRAL